MPLKRLFKPSNARIRLGVGLVLAALFCIQCTRSEATRSGQVAVMGGQTIGHISSQRLAELEKLARTDHRSLLRQGLQNYQAHYQDYTCTFSKTERINGQIRPEQQVDVKFRESPFSVAMHWMVNAPKGDRVLFVDGKYNNQMLVQPKGLLAVLTGGAVTRDPCGKEVMADTLKPVTLFGMKNLMASLLDVYEQGHKNGESTDTFTGVADFCGRKVLVLQRVLTYRKGYPAKTTIWYFDPEWQVPLGLEGYDWNDQLICKYTYSDVKFNVGLGDADFNPQANGIQYKQAQ